MANILEMRNITKEFGTVKVLDGVDFTVQKGEVHALVGANGAGKSTLMKILNGIYTATSGEILLGGQRAVFTSPRDAYGRGVSMIHQELDLVSNLNVSENIYLGREILRGGFLVDRRTMCQRTQQVLDDLGFDIDAREEIGSLSTAKQQLVLVARTCSLGSNLIVMDEPTSSLSVNETEALFKVIGQLREAGISVIYISHYLEEIFRIADKVTVLRNGRKVVTAAIADCTEDQVVEWMVGYKVTKEEKDARDLSQSPDMLRVEGLSDSTGRIKDISLSVRKGEVLGLAGVVGSGRTRLLKTVFGAEKKGGGTVIVDGTPVDIKNPQTAVGLNIGYVPEDRKTEGVVLGRSIGDNIALPELGEKSRGGVISYKSVHSFVAEVVAGQRIKCTSPAQEVVNLSGGNQQKVVIGKWFSGRFKLLIFDQPTRGVDVGAKKEIYQIIRGLAESGVSVIIATDEIEELLNLCDRILVMKKGAIVHEFANDSQALTKADVLARMVN